MRNADKNNDGLKVGWFSPVASAAWESDRLRAYELPMPLWMEHVPDGYYEAKDDDARRLLIVNMHARQQRELEAFSKPPR